MQHELNSGELWSFLRRVLSQGGDIQLDANAGKYKSHEELSIRLDAAARERADELWPKIQAALDAKDEELGLAKSRRDLLQDFLDACRRAVGTADDIDDREVAHDIFLKMNALQQQLDAVLPDAVWAMEYVLNVTATPNTYAGQRAAAFFARPDVQDWLKRQEQKETHT